MKRIIRLTESDLARIVKRVINEAEAGAGTSAKKITKNMGPVEGDEAKHLKISAQVGGMANKLAGNPDVIEFDATLQFSKVPKPNGSFDEKNAGKTMKVKGYFGCKSGKLTTKDPSTGNVVEFYDNSMNMSMMSFEKFLEDSGLCAQGSF